MGITPIDSGSAMTQAAGGTTAGPKTSSTDSSSATAAPKKDAAFVSEKAKDLAALQAGKSAQEEMSESVAVKQEEGPNS